MKTVIQLRASRSVKPTVRGGRAKNAAYRQREYLTEAEIEKLVSAAGDSRNPVRDRLLILMAFRHALRVSELVNLRWQQIHLDMATIHITRAKNGTPGNHGLQGDELRLLRALRRDHPHADFVFLSERKAPLSVDGAQKLIERLGEAAKLPFPIHAHMLRHAAGYALAGRGVDTRTLQAFMGHRSIANTVVYTAVADKRIRNIWGNERAGPSAAPRRSGFRLRHIGDSEFARDRVYWLDDRAKRLSPAHSTSAAHLFIDAETREGRKAVPRAAGSGGVREEGWAVQAQKSPSTGSASTGFL
jgi:Phage integrase family